LELRLQKNMATRKRFLLITGTDEGTSDQTWSRLLSEALASLGELQTVTEQEAVGVIAKAPYELVIIDALAVNRVALLVSRIRAQQPAIRIVIGTASPTWRRAREAFLAGAADYIQKIYNKDELLSELLASLAKAPPAWPR
jgi:DNA-binding NtrC family response regulator